MGGRREKGEGRSYLSYIYVCRCILHLRCISTNKCLGWNLQSEGGEKGMDRVKIRYCGKFTIAVAIAVTKGGGKRSWHFRL